MDENNTPKKPVWTWHCMVPFSTPRKDYKKDRKRYDNFWKSQSEKILDKQLAWINHLSAFFITLIVVLWSTLPQLIELPSWLQFTKLGMENVDWKSNWGNAIFLTIIPGIGGSALHIIPNKIPSKKAKFILNGLIKILPVLILIIVTYLPRQMKLYLKAYRFEQNLGQNAQNLGQNAQNLGQNAQNLGQNAQNLGQNE